MEKEKLLQHLANLEVMASKAMGSKKDHTICENSVIELKKFIDNIFAEPQKDGDK